MGTAVKHPVRGPTRSVRAVVLEVGRRINHLPPTRWAQLDGSTFPLKDGKFFHAQTIPR